MKKWLLFLFLCCLSPGISAAQLSTFCSVFANQKNDWTDFIQPGEALEIHCKYGNAGGIATVTLPPELEFTGAWLDRVGGIDDVQFSGNTAQITGTGHDIWLYAYSVARSKLPPVAEQIEIRVNAQSAATSVLKMQYQKVSVSSDQAGAVTENDVITYTVNVGRYPFGRMKSATLVLPAPPGTDIVSGSLVGGGGGAVSETSSRITISWPDDAPRQQSVSYQVKVWEIWQFQPSDKEIVNGGVYYRFTVEDDRINELGTLLLDTRTETHTAPAVTNKLDRNEFELTLTPDRINLETDEEFNLTATIKNLSVFRLLDVRLNEASISILGDPAATLIQAPASGLVKLDTGETGSLVYRFRALSEGKFKISAEAQGTPAGQGTPTTSDPVNSPEICVGCGSVNLEIILPVGVFPIDEPLLAKVRVTSTLDIPQTISFPKGLLTTNDKEFLTFQLDPVVPFELTKLDPTREFEAIVVPKKFGSAKLRAEVEAQSAEGTGNYFTEEAVTVDPLLVAITALPLVSNTSGGTEPIVNMTVQADTADPGQYIVEDEDGNQIDPMLEVRVRNISNQAVTARLQGVDPKARDKSPVSGRVATTGPFPMDLGKIEGGTAAKKIIPLSIVDDGRFNFSAIVTGTVAGFSKQFNVRGDGAPIAVGAPYPVEIELKIVESQSDITGQGVGEHFSGKKNGAYFVQPGGRVKVIANVNNLTSNYAVEFTGIKAEKRLNAFAAKLTSDIGNGGDAPFVHSHHLDSKSSVILSGEIRTDARGAPAGTVKWLLPADGILIDNLTGDETDLTADDYLITSDAGGWLGDELAVRIVQDNTKAPKQYLGTLESVAYFGIGAMNGVGQWTYDTMDAVGTLGSLAGTASTLTTDDIDNIFGEASRALWEEAELAALGWSSMTPAEKDTFILQATNEVFNRAQLLATAPFDKTSYTEALAFTQNATFFLFNGLENAYASDDPRQIIDIYGNVSGHVAMEVLTAAIPTTKFTEYAKASDLTALADNKALGKSLTHQEDLLRAMKSGPVDESTSRRAWGIGGKNLQDFKAAMKALKIKGYARERAPLSLRLIETLKEAVWKPELMKPKGMSDLDLLILGKPLPILTGKPPGNNALDVKAITAIFKPEPEDVLRRRLRSEGVEAEIIEAAVARAKYRADEFQKYMPEFFKWDQGAGIPVAKNYVDNGVPDPLVQKDAIRDFTFQTVKRAGQPTLYVPKMADSSGVLKFISGDIDWVHFTHLDGSPLAPAAARKVYDVLIRCCGMQHPETISWIKKGQTIFSGKANQISEYIRGQKALLEVSGEGIRAVRVSEKLTRFAKDGRGHLVFFEKGVKSRIKAAAADFETELALLQRKYPDRRILAPFLWGLKLDKLLDDTTIEDKEWSVSSTNDNAFLARQVATGVIEVFDGRNWKPWDISKEPGAIALAPVTETSSGIAAGTSVLQIQDWPEDWPVQMAGRLDSWFQPGNTVIIDPGGSQQTLRTVTALGSLVLDKPLVADYPAGTMVAVVSRSVRIGLESAKDPDSDGLPNVNDNCPDTPNPGQQDLDKDGVGNRCDADADGDGLNSRQEARYGTDPLDPDTDNDGRSDGFEIANGTNPLVNAAALIAPMQLILQGD